MPNTTNQEKKNFRELVLSLKRLNPNWEAKEIADFLLSSSNPPKTKRNSLMKRIRATIKRKTIKDKPRPGAPITVSTPQFLKKVEKLVHLKNKASSRNTTAKLNQQGVKCHRKTVQKTIKKLKLKWFKKRKGMKLSFENKLQRIKCAKLLRKRFGTNPKSQNYKWNRVVNTDFSGKIGLQPFRNTKNDGIYARSRCEINDQLGTSTTQKNQKGIMLWGGISSFGLIPSKAPINVTAWLKSRKAKWFTGELYAEFIRNKAAIEIRKVFGQSDLEPIFQDDQDTKHRTQVALDTVDELFNERIKPEDSNAKLADVYAIENVWGGIKAITGGVEYSNEAELWTAIKKAWRSFSPEKCAEMMEKIPQRLKKVIENDGAQVYEH